LQHYLLNYDQAGSGPPIVLLHGMAASRRYWEGLIPDLSKSHRVIAIDLLGFGLSPKPKNVTYNSETHINAILDTLNHLGITGPFILVGHSMGALLALKFARRYPEKVNKLTLVSMPIYKSAEEAKLHITKGIKSRELAYYGWTSNILCSTWCGFLRPISKHVAKLYIKNQPPHVAEDSVYHTWQAYSQSLENVIAKQTVEADLQKLRMPAVMMYGDREGPPTLDNLQQLKLSKNVRLQVVPGSHNLPLDDPAAVAGAILQDSAAIS
jgi:cis-3-alkyl-4-acyloxetan-2-one decarboxylase